MICEICGNKMTCKNSRGDDAVRYRLYTCSCGNIMYTKEEQSCEKDVKENLTKLNTIQRKISQNKKYNTYL